MGLNLFYHFCRQRGSSWSVGSSARKGTRWSSQFRSTRSLSNARDKFMTVYLISEIQRSESHFTICESWSDTWLPVDTLMEIERLNSRENRRHHRIVAHFLYATWNHLSRPISQKEIDGPYLIVKYFYKFIFSLFYVILTLDSTWILCVLDSIGNRLR